ncbi:cupin domain-containing protein [Solimonas soli]|uniref:cupin domain-containing protein n=1 Tax=Solimonas soli TaxID=413479 RepID=UPI0004852379|nr:cupin domain-containing protein [Solimonas soli]
MKNAHLTAAAILLAAGCALDASGGHAAEAAGKPVVLENFSQAKFAAVPSLPECTKMVGMRGDPSKGPSSLMVKMDGGCAATLHWHTANEEMLILQGVARAQVAGQPEVELKAGAYMLLPAKSHHQFRCVSKEPCIIFDVADTIFDVHNIDANGKEISAEEAIRAAAKSR